MNGVLGSTDCSRRAFLEASLTAGGGLLITLLLPGCRSASPHLPAVAPATLNAFVEISPDGTVTIAAPVPEIGQGVRTALPMIVADELGAPWSSVTVVQAEADERYGAQAVGGSDSVADYWQPLRQAGAAAREMLVAAAAARWGVEAAVCEVAQGEVHHRASGGAFSFGELAGEAARLPVPTDPELKPPGSRTIIGKPVPRVDLREIVTGTATYGFDVEVPGMLYAVVERPPVRGAELKSFDGQPALAVPGVRQVIPLAPLLVGDLFYGAVKGGVVVLAESSWAAMQGRAALKVAWDEGPNAELSSEGIRRRMLAQATRPSDVTVRDEGDVDAQWVAAQHIVEATYELPLLAHGCMEPMCFTADVRPDRCEAWGPTQDPQLLGNVLAAVFRLSPSDVRIYPTLEGGGFGRRLAFDYGVEAALISKTIEAPVKLFWTREDDLHHDYFRTPSTHRMRAAVDDRGRVTAWHHHVVSSSLRRHSAGPKAGHPELYDVGGASNMPYVVPNLRVEYSDIDVGVQLGSWRSVSHSFNVFAVSCFVDEIAASVGADPLEFQLELLGEPRRVTLDLPLPGRRGRPQWDVGLLRRVLTTAAEASGWGEPLKPGRGRGIAACYFKRTYTAHVAEVEVGEDGAVRVERIVAAIDCGTVVNPDGVEAQVEGAAMDGVATVLHWGLKLDHGRVRQSNFDELVLPTLAQAPKIEVLVLPSDRPPSGTGEPPYPSVPPAIANALFAAIGKRVRRLPLDPAELRVGRSQG